MGVRAIDVSTGSDRPLFVLESRQGRLDAWNVQVDPGLPRADRHFSQEIRRLTRIHVRSVEQPVNLDDGDDAVQLAMATRGPNAGVLRVQLGEPRDRLIWAGSRG